MKRVTLQRPWLRFDLADEMPVLSWAINRPGPVLARRILWREVRNADLPRGMDVDRWLARELNGIGAADAVAFLTSRDIGRHVVRQSTVEDVNVVSVVTVGLSNAECVGSRRQPAGQVLGTINIAVEIDRGLTESGLLEALSIVTEARTAAVLTAGIRLSTGRATGTGTDCIAVAAPSGHARFTGKHTAIGEALGRAVFDAVSAGAENWCNETRKARRADA